MIHLTSWSELCNESQPYVLSQQISNIHAFLHQENVQKLVIRSFQLELGTVVLALSVSGRSIMETQAPRIPERALLGIQADPFARQWQGLSP